MFVRDFTEVAVPQQRVVDVERHASCPLWRRRDHPFIVATRESRATRGRMNGSYGSVHTCDSALRVRPDVAPLETLAPVVPQHAGKQELFVGSEKLNRYYESSQKIWEERFR